MANELADNELALGIGAVWGDSGNADAVALVALLPGGCHNGYAPENPSYPLMTFKMPDTTTEDVMNGTYWNEVLVTWQVYTTSRDRSTLDAIVKQLYVTYDATFTLPVLRIMSTKRVSSSSLPNPSENGWIATVLIRYRVG